MGRLRERLREQRMQEQGERSARTQPTATIAVGVRMASRWNVGEGTGFWRVRLFEHDACVEELRGAVQREASSVNALPYEATMAGAQALLDLLSLRALDPSEVHVAVHSPNRTFVHQLAGRARVLAPHLRILWAVTQERLRPFGSVTFYWRRFDGSVPVTRRSRRRSDDTTGTSQ